MTNGDKVRQMDNRELAKFMFSDDRYCTESIRVNFEGNCMETPCTQCMLDWLNKEVDE